MSKRKLESFYAVFNGKEGDKIYSSWDEAGSKGITGAKGCKHRKFSSKEDAEHFILNKGSLLEKEQDKDSIVIYTDGTCRDGIGGYGVWFGDNHKLNAFERFENINSQISELCGVIKALELLNDHHPPNTPSIIRTDSNYVVASINNWIPRIWEPEGWKEKPKKNKDLMKRLWNLYTSRQNCRVEKVKGHSGDYGNEKSHTLANMVYKAKESKVCFECEFNNNNKSV
jgi:ribonuclease HI